MPVRRPTSLPQSCQSRIGVLRVSPFVEDLQRSESERYEARKVYALALQGRIAGLDDGAVRLGSGCKQQWWWQHVADVVWFVAIAAWNAGYAGALIGAFRSADGLLWWRQAEGEVVQGNASMLRSRQGAYRLRAGTAPVAVVMGQALQAPAKQWHSRFEGNLGVAVSVSRARAFLPAIDRRRWWTVPPCC